MEGSTCTRWGRVLRGRVLILRVSVQCSVVRVPFSSLTALYSCLAYLIKSGSSQCVAHTWASVWLMERQSSGQP